MNSTICFLLRLEPNEPNSSLFPCSSINWNERDWFFQLCKTWLKLNLRDVLWKVRDEQWDIIFAGFWCFFCVCFPRGMWRTSLLEFPFFLSTPFKSRHGHIIVQCFWQIGFLRWAPLLYYRTWLRELYYSFLCIKLQFFWDELFTVRGLYQPRQCLKLFTFFLVLDPIIPLS